MADENDVFNMISGSNGIMGVCDTIFIIYKKKRQDENAMMFMTGRDIAERHRGAFRRDGISVGNGRFGRGRGAQTQKARV